MKYASFSTESRPTLRKGYQDQLYESSQYYLTCTCGWEREIEATYGDKLDLIKTKHRLDHLEGKIGGR